MENKKLHRRALKAMANVSLRGNWLSSFAVYLISMLISMFILRFITLTLPSEEQIIAALENLAELIALARTVVNTKTLSLFAVVSVLYMLVMCPLNIGMHSFFLSVARGEKAKIRMIFAPFSSLSSVFSSIGINIIISFFSLLWAIPLVIIPSLLLTFAVALRIPVIIALSSVLFIFGTILAILLTSRYSFALYIFAEGRSGGAVQSFRECREIIRGRAGETMALRATYFGWDIACAIVPGLLIVYNAMFGTTYAKYLYYMRGEIKFFENTASESRTEEQ